MLKRVIPFPLLLLSAALTGCGGAADQSTLSGDAVGESSPPTIVSTTATNSDGPAVIAVPLIANDDYVLVKPDENNELSVSENDTFADETTFEVVDYPSEGELVMEPNGSFVYHPNNEFVGIDSFTYTAGDGTSEQQATVTVDVASSVDPATLGFTAVKPSADSKVIYVSSSMGDDSNDCESPSAPCESLDAAFAKVRAGSPDHVYLKRGDAWRDQKLSALKSGRSPSEPAVVSAYGGSGDRPKIQHSDNIIGLTGGDKVVSNLHIIGLHFDAYKMDVDDPEFSGTNEDLATLMFLSNNESVLLEDNLFDHLEVVVQAHDGGNPKDFTLRRNIWTGAYGDTSSFSQKKRPSNIYAAGVDGLVIEENVFDRGGWNPEAEGAAANMYNHNLYLQSSNNGDKLELRNNIITRGASHGAQLRAGGVAEENFFARNAVGLLIGYDKEPLKDGVKAHAINNVITEGASMVKGSEPCSGENLCTPAQWGLDFYVNGNADWLAQGNVVHSLDESEYTWEQQYDRLITRGFKGIDDPAVVAVDNVQSAWGENIVENVAEVDVEGRTLGDYYAQLIADGTLSAEFAGEDDFDRFMTAVKSRGAQQWDEALTAKAINDYVREGFGL